MSTQQSGKVTAKEARSMLLSKCSPIINDLLLLATGESQPNHPDRKNLNVDEGARQQVLDIIAPMMVQAGDTQKIEAGTTAQIINMLSEGNITIQEAKSLMEVINVQTNIESMKELVAKMNTFGITVDM